MFASGSENGTISLWDVESGTILHTFTGHDSEITSIAWHPNGEIFASGSDDTTIKLWDAKTGALLLSNIGPGHVNEITSLAFSPDGSILASSQDSTIVFWRVRQSMLFRPLSFKPAYVLGGNDDLLSWAGFSQDEGIWFPHRYSALDRRIKQWESLQHELGDTLVGEKGVDIGQIIFNHLT